MSIVCSSMCGSSAVCSYGSGGSSNAMVGSSLYGLETVFSRLYSPAAGPLAQLVEQGTLNPKVEGSNPSRPIAQRSPRSGREGGLGKRDFPPARTGTPAPDLQPPNSGGLP